MDEDNPASSCADNGFEQRDAVLVQHPQRAGFVLMVVERSCFAVGITLVKGASMRWQ
jgi:hypothetical protein